MMPDFLQGFQIPSIVIWIAAIGVAWVGLRLIFRLARKVFAWGCFGIIVLGFVLVFIQYFQGG